MARNRGNMGGRSHGRRGHHNNQYQERGGRGIGGRGRGRGADPPPPPHPAQRPPPPSPPLLRPPPLAPQPSPWLRPPQQSPWFRSPPSAPQPSPLLRPPESQALGPVHEAGGASSSQSVELLQSSPRKTSLQQEAQASSSQFETGGSSRGPWGGTAATFQSQRSSHSQGSAGPVHEARASSSQSSLRKTSPQGTVSCKKVNIFANYFHVQFDANTTIIHYDVDVQLRKPSGELQSGNISKTSLLAIKDKVLLQMPPSEPPLSSTTAYDGERNIFSAAILQAGIFNVEVSDAQQDRMKTYQVTLKEVKRLQLQNLVDYLNRQSENIPRDVVQALEVVLKGNPSSKRAPVGKSFFPGNFQGDPLRNGIVALQGFQTSLKHTQQGEALCLDYTVLAFYQPVPVIEFLRQRVTGFHGVNDVSNRNLRPQIERALIGLKVNVTHRVTKQRYTIFALTNDRTSDLHFNLEDPKGVVPTSRVGLVKYFRDKYNAKILHKGIPCLDVGSRNRSNYMPMEFCVVAQGQRCPNDLLDSLDTRELRKRSLAIPRDRRNEICKMVAAEDGPLGGGVARSFGMEVSKNMTRIVGRLLPPPSLMVGNRIVIGVSNDKSHWNLAKNSVVHGIPLKSWALLDFTANELNADSFLKSLKDRCGELGIGMQEPLRCMGYSMAELDNAETLRKLIESVVVKCNNKPQIILCAMQAQHPGYKTLKWITETQIGVVTQCFLSSRANETRNQNQYLTNLAIKINAKLGGCNTQLEHGIPGFNVRDPVMFIGADVNHPGANSSEECPSIAAVVGSLNWPTANRYGARVRPQAHRAEPIENFGSMCSSLIEAYEKSNGVKPRRIVVFRDGVSEGQFEMVLNVELADLRKVVYSERYRPTITVVLAQKRHSTRLFLEGEKGSIENIQSGTVVDTMITHPFRKNFYLNSHHGILGTSKATHYHVLHDDHKFSREQMELFIYHLCYTFARCTRPVSLVPPVFYADLAAYRGRLYQEVISQSNLPPRSEEAYKLNQDLEDIMFFV